MLTCTKLCLRLLRCSKPEVPQKTGEKSNTHGSACPSVLLALVFTAFAFAVYFSTAFLETPLCYYLTGSTTILETISCNCAMLHVRDR